MKQRSYNRELAISNSCVVDVFNQITIDRRDGTGCVEKEILVPCVYGDRSNTLKQIETRNGIVKLPMMSIVRGGITKDSSRVHSVNEFITKNAEGFFDIKTLVGIPLNIGYELEILTKYQEDMDQILSNFIPFFNPAIYITWKLPSGNGNAKCALIWDGSVNTTYFTDDETKSPRILCTVNFTLRTWMFPGIWETTDCDTGEKTTATIDQPTIYHIDMFMDGTGETFTGSYNPAAPNAGFFAVPNTMTIDEFESNVKAGLISQDYSYDSFKMSVNNDCRGYFMKLYAEIGGDLYDPDNKADLQFMFDNIDDPTAVFTNQQGDEVNLQSYMDKDKVKIYWQSLLLDPDWSGYIEIAD